MDVIIRAGAAMTLKAGGRRVRLRALTETHVGDADDGVWQIPVMASGDDLADGLNGTVEIATAQGLVLAEAQVVRGPSGCLLQGEHTLRRLQRRSEVRQPVELPLSLAVPTRAPVFKDTELDHDVTVSETVRPERGPVQIVTGSTLNVSAGGIMARLDRHVPDLELFRRDVYLELTLPDGEVVPARMRIIELTHSTLRGPFLAISTRGRERLARLVFAEERAALVERRRRQEVSDRVGQLPADRAGFGGNPGSSRRRARP